MAVQRKGRFKRELTEQGLSKKKKITNLGVNFPSLQESMGSKEKSNVVLAATFDCSFWPEFMDHALRRIHRQLELDKMLQIT